MSISVVGDSRIRIQRDGPPGLPFATAPVPIVPDESERKRGVSFREEVIKLDRFHRGRLSLGKTILRRRIGCDGKRTVRFCQTEVGQCIVGIQVDCLLEELYTFSDLRRDKSGMMITSR